LGSPLVLKCNGIADSVPVNAGTYRFTVDLPVGANYKTKSGVSLGTLKIVKAMPSKASFVYDLSPETYDGKSHATEVLPHDSIVGIGRVTVLYK
jgi:hypothetical protein